MADKSTKPRDAIVSMLARDGLGREPTTASLGRWQRVGNRRRQLLAYTVLALACAALALVLVGVHWHRATESSRIEAAQSLAAALAQRLPGELARIRSDADRQRAVYRDLVGQFALALDGVRGTLEASVLRREGGATGWREVLAVTAVGPSPRPVGAARSLGPESVDATRLRDPHTGDWLIYGAPADGETILVELRLQALTPDWVRLLPPLLLAYVLFVLLWLAGALRLAHRFGAPVDALRAIATDLRAGRGVPAPDKRLAELRPAAAMLNEFAWAGRERDRMQAALSRYVSAAVARIAADSDDFLRAHGKEVPVTVMFADLYQFTELSQSMSAGQVLEMLNRCFSVFDFAIQKYNGIVDKFIGDGVMAIFNAPVPDRNHAQHAVMAAIEMQAGLTKLRQNLSLPSLRIGVGINTGTALVGNFGSEGRIQYTAIGPTVNLASRIETFTRSIGGGIAIGAATAAQLDDDFVLEPVTGARLKGVRELQTVYKVKSKIRRRV